MTGQIISSAPYEYCATGADYREMMAARELLDGIRQKNSALADELGGKPVAPAYLKQVLDNMSPRAPKISFSMPPKEPSASGSVLPLEEMIAINFYKRHTNEISAAFTIFNDDKPKSFDIGMITLRALEAVFNTHGRTFPEMEAIFYIQGQFIRNISNIRYKQGLLEFLRGFPKDDGLLSLIAGKLIYLCETA